MAYDIGPRIGIEGEAEYRAQMNNIITQTKTLHAEMRAMSSAWDKDTSAKEKAAQKTKMLKEQIGLQEQKLAQANNMLDQATAKYGENSNQALRWRQAVANAQTELNRLNDELRNTPNHLQAMGQQMQATGQKIQAVGKAVTSTGKTLTRTVTTPILAIGVAAVKTASDFDTSMSKVAAVSGATGSELAQLRTKARELGSQTKFSASEAAEAMNYMAMAGWKTSEMLEGIDGVMNLAAASGEDLATTSDIVTDALTAFGKSAKDSGRLADIMASASSNANTNVAMMGETFKYAAPVAGALGASMEDTAVAIGLMANAGIKASNAGTALRTGLSRLTGTEKKARDAMDKYGIALKTNEDGSVNLRETMVTLREKLGDLSETEQVAAAKAIFGANAYAGWLAVINGSDEDFNKLTNAIDNSAGTAKRMAEIMQDNLGGKVTRLKSQVQELGISFGEQLIPYVSKAVDWIQDAVEKFSNLSDSEKDQIIKMAAIAAAAGPVLTVAGNLITAGGKIYSTAGKAIEIIGGLTAAAEGASAGVGILGAAMGALPIIGVVAGITAVGAAVYALSKASGDGENSVARLSAEMGKTISSAEGARKSLDNTVKSVSDMNAKHAESVEKTEAAAKLAERYANELTELAGKTKKSTTEQARMKALVGMLNKIYPDLGLAIDETTGDLNMSTQALKDNIAQLKEQARVAALNKILEEELSKLVEVEKKVIETEGKRDELLEKSSEAAEKQNEIYAAMKAEEDELAAAQENYNKVLGDSTSTADDLTDASIRLENAQNAVNDSVVYINGTMVEAAPALERYANAQQEASDEAKKLDKSIAEANEESDKLAQTFEKSQERMDKYTDSLGLSSEASEDASESAETFGTSIEGAADSAENAGDTLEDVAGKISEAWDKTYEQTRESVMGQKGLFDELEEAEKTSVSEMAENLHKHVEAYRSWNENAKTLMESERYATDENFRAMVNSIVSAGTDMAPELQAIVDAFQSGDDDLETLLQDYGTMSKLADDTATATANATTAAEYGLEEMNSAFVSGRENIDSSTKMYAATYDIFNSSIEQRTGQAPKAVEEDMREINYAFRSGYKPTKNGVDSIVKEAGNLPKGISAQTSASRKASSEFVKASYSPIQSEKGTFSSVSRQTGMEAQQLPNAINSQKAAASAAARGLLTSAAAAITSSRSGITTASKTSGLETRQLSVTINAQKPGATAASKNLGAGAKEGLESTKSLIRSTALNVGKEGGVGIKTGAESAKGSAKDGGGKLATALADGIKGKKDSVKSAGKTLANAGKDGISSVSTSSARSWGQHLGDNLVSGIRSRVSAARAAAEALARAASGPLKHSVPKEGPLKHDDVWGMHLAENFANAMNKGAPLVKASAAELAKAATVNTYVDPMDISGKGVLGSTIKNSIDLSNIPGIDPEAIYEAVRAGTSGITIQIGERELGRVLHDMGVAFS